MVEFAWCEASIYLWFSSTTELKFPCPNWDFIVDENAIYKGQTGNYSNPIMKWMLHQDLTPGFFQWALHFNFIDILTLRNLKISIIYMPVQELWLK